MGRAFSTNIPGLYSSTLKRRSKITQRNEVERVSRTQIDVIPPTSRTVQICRIQRARGRRRTPTIAASHARISAEATTETVHRILLSFWSNHSRGAINSRPWHEKQE
jgi:hypothetical protein